MDKNVGGLIKIFAFMILALLEIVSVIFTFMFLVDGLYVYSFAILLVGTICSLFSFTLVYGFGQIVDNTYEMKKEFEDFCEDNEKNFYNIYKRLEMLDKNTSDKSKVDIENTNDSTKKDNKKTKQKTKDKTKNNGYDDEITEFIISKMINENNK